MRKRIRIVGHPAFHLLLGVAISVVAYVLFSWVPLFRQIELNTLDMRYRSRPPIQTVPELGTVDIDMATIDLSGSWPVSRTLYAELMYVLRDYDARLMSMDIFFPDPSPLAVAPEQVAEARRLAAEPGADQTLQALLDRMARGADAVLQEALRETQLTVLAQTFSTADPDEFPYTAAIDRKTRAMTRDAMRPAHRRSLELAQPLSLRYDAPVGRNDTIARAYFVEPPDPRFLEHAVGLGFAQILYDVDGTVRRYPLFLHYAGRLYPSLGLMAVSRVTGVPLSAMEIVPGSHVRLPAARVPGDVGGGRVRDIRIPVDRFLRMKTNWAGDYLGTFTHFPATLLLEFRADDLIRRRIQAYGSDAAALISGGVETITAEVVTRKLLGQEQAALIVRDLLLARLVEWAQAADPAGRAAFLADYAAADDSETQRLLGAIWDQVADNERLLGLLRADPEASLDDLAAALKRDDPLDAARRHAVDRFRFAITRGKDPEACRPLYFRAPEDVSAGGLSPLDLAGKVLFVGLTATGTHDFNPMPFSARYPMVGLHVNAANTVLTGQFIRDPPEGVTYLIVLLCAVLMVYAVPRLHPVIAVAAVLVLMAAYVWIGQLAFNRFGLWLPVAAPLVALVATYLAVVVYHFLAERREKRKVRSAFSKYVSASVVNQVLQNPDMLRLGGERRTMTVFFSDLKGFTTISETFSPEDMVALLNEYLDHMTRIIHNHAGTLDKYEGDGIMAFWSAPLEQADHAYRACCAALDSVHELATVLRPKWEAEGKPYLTVRIGLNTGPMVVGNMGSLTRMEYSVMGDAVNVGARLEPVNKVFGTRIIMSETTREQVTDSINDRELGLIRIRGRKQKVRVFEVVGRVGDTTPEQERLWKLYREGLEWYRGRRWEEATRAFNAALAIDGEDGPSLAYLERCMQYRVEPPDEAWDGGFDTGDV